MTTATIAAALAGAIALCGSAAAAPASFATGQNGSAFVERVQGNYYGRYYYYNGRYYPPWPPACPYRYHYECWTDARGYRACGCRPDFGLY